MKENPGCVGCLGCLGILALFMLVSSFITYGKQWAINKLEEMADESLNKPDSSKKHSIYLDVIFHQGLCKQSVNVQVIDDNRTVIAQKYLTGGLMEVRQRPILYNCYYSGVIENVPEVRQYNITGFGTYSLRKMKENNWRINVGKPETDPMKIKLETQP